MAKKNQLPTSRTFINITNVVQNVMITLNSVFFKRSKHYLMWSFGIGKNGKKSQLWKLIAKIDAAVSSINYFKSSCKINSMLQK